MILTNPVSLDMVLTIGDGGEYEDYILYKTLYVLNVSKKEKFD